MARYSIFDPKLNLSQTLINAFETFSLRPCFGRRKTQLTASGVENLKEYEWFTYQQIFERSLNFGRGLKKLLPEVSNNIFK